MIAGLMNPFRKWGPKVAFSISDQGTVSGANFVLNILLARWLSPSQYGAFAISFSIFLCLSGFHNALVLEPMSVLGPARHNKHLSSYLGSVFWIHIGVTTCLSVILAITTLVLFAIGAEISKAFLGLSITAPFILLFWFYRRSRYVELRPDLALKASLIYGICLLTGLFLMQRKGWLSPCSVFILMAFASLSGVTTFSKSLRLKNFSWAGTNPGIRVVLLEHWTYGKWVVGSAFVFPLSRSLYLPLIGIVGGLAQAGAFRGLQNLVQPLQQILIALGHLFIPWLAGQRDTYNKIILKKNLTKLVLFNVSLASVYGLLMILSGKRVISFLYGYGFYDQFVWLLPYFALVVILGAALQGVAIGMKALERPDSVFVSEALAAAFTLTIGIYMLWAWSLHGALMGLILSRVLATMTLSGLMRRHMRRLY